MTKRFYKTVAARPEGGGYGVCLDERALKTPAGNTLVVPTMALAEAIAQEWDRQGETVEPASMPLTRLANTAVDRVRGAYDEVAAATAAYGVSDVLCHRSDRDPSLAEREETEWQPVLDWAAQDLGVQFVTAMGIMPVSQPDEALAACRARIEAFDAPALAAISEMTSLLGSLILALAVTAGHLEAPEAFRLSHLEETHQEERWGLDEEAHARREARKADFLAACEFLRLLEA